MEQYIYGMRNRPPFIGTCPDGYRAIESPDYLYGCVVYSRLLSAEEVYRYELIPVSPNAFPFAVGDSVLVNEIDDAQVLGFETGGFVRVRYAFDGTTEGVVNWRVIDAS